MPFKFVTLGAVLFVAVWLITTVLLSLYIGNFGNYDATYGTLGGVVILLLWFYVTSLLMLLGAEINAMIDERTQPEDMARRRAEKQAAAGLPPTGKRKESKQAA